MQRWFRRMVPVMAVLAALVLAACGGNGGSSGGSSGGDPQPGGTAVEEPAVGPRQGGTLVMSKVHDADSLDPHTSNALVSREIYNMIYDRLVYIDSEGNPRPWLAESWKMNEDGTEITFRLVQGRKFHDGTPVNAEAVKFTFDRMLDPSLGSSAATQFSALDRVEVVDEYTVRFVMKEPFAPIFNSLASAFGGIISPAAVEKYGEDFGRNPVGSGPFMFESWTPGTEIVFVRNPEYTTLREDVENKGAPYLDKVVIRIINDDSARINAIMAGEIDMGPVSYTQAEMADADPNIDLVVLEKAANINYLEFNQRKPPFDDVRVRKAVGYAIDFDEIIDTVYFGHASRNKTMIPTGVAGYNEALGEQYGYDYDPDRARQLLEEAGWVDIDGDGVREKNGQRLTVELLTWTATATDRIAQLIQAQLADVGFEVTLNLMEAGTFLAVGKEGHQHFDWMRTTWSEPIILSRALSHGGNFANFEHAELQALLDEAATTVDWGKRRQLLDEAQRVILEDALAIPGFTDHVIMMVRDRVHGFKWDALGWELLNDIWLDG